MTKSYRVLCYGVELARYDNLTVAQAEAERHIRIKCNYGMMPWAADIVWFRTTATAPTPLHPIDVMTYAAAAHGGWLNHSIEELI